MNVSHPSRTSLLGSLLFLGAFFAALFFNGAELIWYSVSLIYFLLFSVYAINEQYNHDVKLKLNGLTVSILLYFFWLALNILFNPITFLGVVNFWWVGVLPLTYLAICATEDAALLWKYIYRLLLACGLLLASYAIYQYFFVHGHATATFLNKNSLAGLINLLMFPLLGYLFIRTKYTWQIFTAIFIFIFLLGIIQSRGAILSALVALSLFLIILFRYIDKRKLIQLAVICFSAFIFANIAVNLNPLAPTEDLLEQAASLQNLETAGASRYRIWGPAWDLFLQHPLTGIGLGTYYLSIPPTLHPLDASANFYVHNDYLQIALETGLPGLLILLAIVLFFFKRGYTVWTSKQTIEEKIIFFSIFAGVLTFLIHSLFTFNFYIMPTAMVAGLYLGILHRLSIDLLPGKLISVNVKLHLRPIAFYLSLGLLTIVLGNYFVTLALGSYYHKQGLKLAAQAQLEKAHVAFLNAQRLSPMIDTYLTSDADLLLRSAIALKDKPKLAMDLLDEADKKLLVANKLNPLRPMTPYIQAGILEQRGNENPLPVINAYSTALQLNPRYLPARVDLARFLLKLDDKENAYHILREGIDYTYKQVTPAFLDLLALTASSADTVGNYALGKQLRARLDYYQRMVNVQPRLHPVMNEKARQ